MPQNLVVQSFECGPLQTNTYLLLDRATNQAVVIDPSIGTDAALATMRGWQSEGVKLQAIWNTHGHFDHVYDNARWKAEFNVPILAHPADAFFLEHLREQALWFGIPAPDVALPAQTLEEGQILSLGEHRATVIEIPGHSPGSVGFDFGDFIISGDVLFAGSVGRTDLPGSSDAELATSLRRLFDLSPQTRILPGHGPETTIETESHSNAVARQFLARF